MKKPEVVTNNLTAMLVTIALCGSTGWMNLALAEAVGTAAADPVTAPAAAPAEQSVAEDPVTAPAAAAAEQSVTEDPATAPAAAPAEQSVAEDPATAPASAAAATEKSIAEDLDPVHPENANRAEMNRRIAQRKAAAKARRESMERWRSQRRWWNHPEAEERRLWNQARSQWYRDMAATRRSQYEQYRPDYGREYRYGYRRVYP